MRITTFARGDDVLERGERHTRFDGAGAVLSPAGPLLSLPITARLHNAGKIRIGLFRDWKLEPERFLTAGEHEALIITAPQQVGTFDSAVAFRNDDTVARVEDYVTDLYNCSQRITLDVLQDLRPLRNAP